MAGIDKAITVLFLIASGAVVSKWKTSPAWCPFKKEEKNENQDV